MPFIGRTVLALSFILRATMSAKAQTLPDTIAAPGETVVLTVHAEDARVYECKAGPDGKLAWVYVGPNGVHIDGIVVVGKVSGSAPGATAADIPWLKLQVTVSRGNSVVTDVTTVQRINTKGGKLEGACDVAGSFKSVPYAADYVFLR